MPDQEVELHFGHLVERLDDVSIGPDGPSLVTGGDSKSPLAEGRLRPNIQTIQGQRVSMIRDDVVGDLKDDSLPLEPVVSPVEGPRLVIAADHQRRASV